MSPEERGRAELSAWGRLDVDEIMSHFSADAVWDNVATRAFHPCLPLDRTSVQLQRLPAGGLTDVEEHLSSRGPSRGTQLLQVNPGTVCGLHRADGHEIMFAPLAE